MGHSVPQQSARLRWALPKSGDLDIENVGLRADAFGRQVGNPKDTAGQVGTALHNVHIEMIGKLRLTAGAALLGLSSSRPHNIQRMSMPDFAKI